MEGLFYEIPLNGSYVLLWPTVVSSSVHKVFTAATHYQKKNETLVRMPLHELMEQSDSKNSPLIKIVKWSSVKPTMIQFPFSQIN